MQKQIFVYHNTKHAGIQDSSNITVISTKSFTPKRLFYDHLIMIYAL